MRELRATIKVGAQGYMILADKVYAVINHLCELIHMHPVFIGDSAAEIQRKMFKVSAFEMKSAPCNLSTEFNKMVLNFIDKH